MDITVEQICGVVIIVSGKVEGKIHPRNGREGSEGEHRYSSTLS